MNPMIYWHIRRIFLHHVGRGDEYNEHSSATEGAHDWVSGCCVRMAAACFGKQSKLKREVCPMRWLDWPGRGLCWHPREAPAPRSVLSVLAAEVANRTPRLTARPHRAQVLDWPSSGSWLLQSCLPAPVLSECVSNCEIDMDFQVNSSSMWPEKVK